MTAFEYALLSVAWYACATQTRNGAPTLVCLVNCALFGVLSALKLTQIALGQ